MVRNATPEERGFELWLAKLATLKIEILSEQLEQDEREERESAAPFDLDKIEPADN